MKSAFWSSICALTTLVAPSTVMAQTFDGIGFIGGASYSASWAVSIDGKTVAGTGATVGTGSAHPVSWVRNDGLVDLGLVPGSTVGATGGCSGISADGTVIVGLSTDLGTTRVFVRTPTSYSFIDNANSAAAHISPDAAIVYGKNGTTGPSPNAGFYWTTSSGRVVVPNTVFLASNYDGSTLGGISDHVFGYSSLGNPIHGNTPTTWTLANGAVPLLDNGRMTSTVGAAAGSNMPVGEGAATMGGNQ